MGYDGTLKFDTSIDTNSFQSGLNKMSSIAGTAMKATTAVLTTATTAVIAIGTAALKSGKEFDTAMSQLAATMGTSVDNIQELEDKAKEMGSTTKFTATEAAEGLNILAMAGLKAEEQIAGIETVLNLASAGAMSLDSAASYVTGTVKGFADSMDNAEYYADLMAKGATMANTSVTGLGEALSGSAATANAYGQSAENVTLSLLRLAEQNVTGSEAATALSRAMMDLYTPTDAAAKALDNLGISAYDSSGNAREFNTVVDELNSALADMSDAEANALKNTIFTTYGLQAFNKMTVSSTEKVEEFADGLANAYGSAAEQAATQLDNLEGDMTLFSSAMDGFLLSIYDSLSSSARSVVQLGTSCISELTEAFEKDGYEGLISAAGRILADLVQKAADAAPMLIDTATNLVTSFCNALTDNPGIGESGAGLITSLISAIISCTGKMWSTAIALVGQFAGGIAEGAPEIVQAATDCIADIVDAVVEYGPTILRAGAQVAMSFAEGIAEALPDAVSKGTEIIESLSQGIRETLPELIPLAMEALMNFSGTLRENTGYIVDAGLELIMSLAQSLIDNIPTFVETVPTIITNLAGIINDNAPKLLACGIKLVTSLAMGVIRAIPTIIANIPQIVQAIVSVLTAYNWLSLGSKIVSLIKEGIASLATAIPEALRNIGQTAKDWLGAIQWDTLGADIVDLILIGIDALTTTLPATLKTLATTAMNAILSIDWLSLATNLVTILVSGIVSAGASLVMAVIDLGIRVVTAIGDYLSELPEKIYGWLIGAVSYVISWGSQIYEEASNAISNMVSSIGEFLAGLPESIAYWLGYAVGTFISWGLDIATWVTTEIPSIIADIGTFFSELPENIALWLEDALLRVTQWGASLLSSASSAALGAINAAVTWFQQLPGKVWTCLTNAITRVTQFASQLKSKATSAAAGFVSNILSGLSSLPAQVTTIGSNIVTGIWNGISSGWEWLKNKVKGLADSLLQGVKDALDINSPSKVFAEEVGYWIPLGIGVGADESMPELEKQLDDELSHLAYKMMRTVEIETGSIAVQTKEKAQHKADTEAPKGGDTYVDQHIEQENNYHVPVATPSETSKAQREAARKLLGGVK